MYSRPKIVLSSMLRGQELRQVSRLKLLGLIVSKNANYSNFALTRQLIKIVAEELKKQSDERPCTMQKITPFLWFDDKAEEAAKFYTSIFKNSKVGKITRYDEEAAGPTGRPAGSVMTVEFELEGQEFVALNGGPMFKFTQAIFVVVNCETNKEVDYFCA